MGKRDTTLQNAPRREACTGAQAIRGKVPVTDQLGVGASPKKIMRLSDVQGVSLHKRKNKHHEINLQREIHRYLTLRGVFCWIEFQPSGRMQYQMGRHPSSVGVSDIIGSVSLQYMARPMPFAMEVKFGKNKPSPKQEDFLDRARDEGWLTCVVYSIEDVEKWLKEIGAR